MTHRVAEILKFAYSTRFTCPNYCMRFLYLLLFMFTVLLAPVSAQQISIELAKGPLPINQYFTISVKLQDQTLTDISAFPEIEGFKKSTRFSSTKTMIVGGNTTTIFTITQNYAALDEGVFTVKPFAMKVNGKTIQSQGGSVTITPMSDAVPQGNQLPNLVVPEAEADVAEGQQEYIEKDDNAFLTLYTGKDEVYVGEALSVILYFYLAEEDRRLLDFYDFANQMNAIMRQLKLSHVWEETFDFSEVAPENVIVEGKPYLRFRLYEAVLYPLNTKPIIFPQLSLKMIKYKVSANPNLLQDDRQEGFKTYFARERSVQVKELPPHPLRDVVPVGRYRLLERLSNKQAEINKSFNYLLQLQGEGNLSAVMAPQPQPVTGLDIFPPDIRQDITRQSGRVFGSKTFSYTIIPREPSEYALKEAFQLIYFDPVTARYDTLQPKLQVQVTGLRDADAVPMTRDLGAFYNIINSENDKLVRLDEFDNIKKYTNIILVLLLMVASFIFFKRKDI